MIMLCLLPFLQYDGVKRVNVEGCETLTLLFTILIIIINIEPFLENLNISRSSNSEYSEIYDDMRDGNLEIYTRIGKTLMGWANHFRLFTPVLFFYYLTKDSFNKYILWGLVMSMINLLLYWINIGTRGGIVTQFLLFIMTYILFLPLIPYKIISLIKKYSLFVFIPAFLFFVGVTVSRYNAKSNPNKSLVGWLLLYSSEGPIKFNSEMWIGEHNTKGDVNANFIKDILGMKTYTTYEDRDEHYLAKNGRRIEVFYTYVGDFVSDFGYVGGIIICILLYFITKGIMKKEGIVPLQNFIIILYIAHTYSIGFASNVYRSYNLQKGTFYMLIVFCIFCMVQNWANIQNSIENYNDKDRLK